ncbi:MAG: AraC family transcriptional regulator [Aristaeellaceae bacterium]
MRSLEPYVREDSAYYNFSPSLLAREHLLYVLCVGDFTYAPGYALSRTSFDSYLMEIILEGQVEIETEGEHLTAHAGQAVLIDCNKPHRYQSDTGWHALWVHFDGAAAKGYFRLVKRQNGLAFSTRHLPEVREALQSIFTMFHGKHSLSEVSMALYLTQALTAMTQPAELALVNTCAGVIDQAVACISRKVGREPSVAELARMVGLSEYHFIRVFRQVMGMTPRQYIIASRMNHARYLLKTTALPVGEIAAMAGYASESMFTAAFRRTQGMTPTQYRTGRLPVDIKEDKQP